MADEKKGTDKPQDKSPAPKYWNPAAPKTSTTYTAEAQVVKLKPLWTDLHR